MKMFYVLLLGLVLAGPVAEAATPDFSNFTDMSLMSEFDVSPELVAESRCSEAISEVCVAVAVKSSCSTCHAKSVHGSLYGEVTNKINLEIQPVSLMSILYPDIHKTMTNFEGRSIHDPPV